MRACVFLCGARRAGATCWPQYQVEGALPALLPNSPRLSHTSELRSQTPALLGGASAQTKVDWELARHACLCHVLLHRTQDDVEVKLMMGDELRLRHKCPAGRPAWEGTGHVIVTGGSSEEVSSDLGVALGIISSSPPALCTSRALLC
jgi:hypothetical protein